MVEYLVLTLFSFLFTVCVSLFCLQYRAFSSSGAGITSRTAQWKSKVEVGSCRVSQVTGSPAEGRNPTLCTYTHTYTHKIKL